MWPITFLKKMMLVYLDMSRNFLLSLFSGSSSKCVFLWIHPVLLSWNKSYRGETLKLKSLPLWILFQDIDITKLDVSKETHCKCTRKSASGKEKIDLACALYTFGYLVKTPKISQEPSEKNIYPTLLGWKESGPADIFQHEPHNIRFFGNELK